MKQGTIGIIGAMDIEVDELSARLNAPRTATFGGIKFVCGEMFGRDVVIAKSGMGKVFSAICAQTMILNFSPSYIINSGIAGGINKSLGVLDMVIADKVVQYDMDFTATGRPLGYFPDMHKIFFECDGELCERLESAASGFGNRVFRGVVATGDSFVADNEKSERLREIFGADACEMEGGSIGQVCEFNGVPFCVLRVISDGGNDDAFSDVKKFGELAAERSISVIQAFLKGL